MVERRCKSYCLLFQHHPPVHKQTAGGLFGFHTYVNVRSAPMTEKLGFRGILLFSIFTDIFPHRSPKESVSMRLYNGKMAMDSRTIGELVCPRLPGSSIEKNGRQKRLTITRTATFEQWIAKCRAASLWGSARQNYYRRWSCHTTI